ncbi:MULTISPECIES: class I SAM-dependent DNA methyltransferase [unclassified Nocardiopsis]|uniref:class I SAM-dependent DNA methyltransferase n=1 Tax=Nocardiopsis TaxID=2013 RepID=UPI00387B044B
MFSAEKIDPAVDVLAELAGKGRALEFAIGTGRIALPLAERGVPVHGIDLSPAMVERMRAKPGGEDIEVAIGDFTAVRVPGEFSLVFLVFNTIMNVTTQDEQVECFVNAAAHLERGGRFVVEVGVPELRRLPKGQNMVPFHAGEGVLAYDLYETATQRSSSNYVKVAGGKGSFRSIPFRYVWPSELDLMARIAGMRLVDRWEDWDRTPFGDESENHVSVWEKVVD